ncbi:MAG: hypothetical protein AB8B55_11690, partial [Mariniblastus sp.]
MTTKVFGCPNCQQPFQVSVEHAGQAVQCPSCANAVEIPKEAFATGSSPAPLPQRESTLAPQQEVFACPSCSGQFGITSDMYGVTVGCPHCQTGVAIQPQAQPESQAEAEMIAPDIVAAPISKLRRKKKQAKPTTENTKDLFAPGFTPNSDAPPSSPAKTKERQSKPPQPKAPPQSMAAVQPKAPDKTKTAAKANAAAKA